MRALRIFISGLALAALTGCAGYRLGSVNGMPSGARSIEVQPFNNQTLQPRLGDDLTQSVRERIQTDATYRLVTREHGDVVVSGVIHEYLRQGLGFLSTDFATPENYRLDMVVRVTARDRSTGKLILDKEVKGGTFVHIGNDLASAERQAGPQLTEDVARNIVELLTEGGW